MITPKDNTCENKLLLLSFDTLKGLRASHLHEEKRQDKEKMH